MPCLGAEMDLTTRCSCLIAVLSLVVLTGGCTASVSGTGNSSDSSTTSSASSATGSATSSSGSDSSDGSASGSSGSSGRSGSGGGSGSAGNPNPPPGLVTYDLPHKGDDLSDQSRWVSGLENKCTDAGWRRDCLTFKYEVYETTSGGRWKPIPNPGRDYDSDRYEWCKVADMDPPPGSVRVGTRIVIKIQCKLSETYGSSGTGGAGAGNRGSRSAGSGGPGADGASSGNTG
jgi:hypothetical protein